jgi:hypothetical protein
MSPFISSEGSVFSAITIESLADLGLPVSFAEAQDYRLPASATMDRMGPIVDLSGDIIRAPLIPVDATGRMKRLILRR